MENLLKLFVSLKLKGPTFHCLKYIKNLIDEKHLAITIISSPPGERIVTDSLNNTNTEIITRNNGRGVIIEEWEMLEAIASNSFL